MRPNADSRAETCTTSSLVYAAKEPVFSKDIKVLQTAPLVVKFLASTVVKSGSLGSHATAVF
jgi:hypothetical protein